MFELRKYQKEAVEKGVSFLTGYEKCGAIIVAPMGAGKSILVSAIAKELEGNTLVLQPSKELVEQNVAKAKAMGIYDIKIFSASCGKKDIGKCTFATPLSIVKHKELLDSFSHLIVDECFISGTKVDNKNIEDIKVGDLIDSFNHKTNNIEKRKVLAISKKKLKENLYLTNLKDRSIISTGNHPIWVLNKRYVPVNKLKIGDIVYAKERKYNKKTSVFRMWSISNNKKLPSILEIQEIWKDLPQRVFFHCKGRCYFCFKTSTKNYFFVGVSKENVREAKGDKSQTLYSGWEWKNNAKTTKKITKLSRGELAIRIYSQNKFTQKKSVTPSNVIQNRHSQSNAKNSNRSRWWFSRFLFKKTARPKKGKIFNRERVESIEIYKPRDKQKNGKNSDTTTYVYNLKVEFNNNYFANGILVHNCDLANARGGVYEEIINYLGGKVLGLTATPYRLHAYTDFKTGQLAVVAKFLTRTRPRLFSKIIHITQIQELYKNNFLCPIEYELNGNYDHSELKLNSTGMNFDEKSVELYNQSHQITEIATTIIASEKSSHILIFMQSVQESNDLAQYLKDKGISSASVSAKTPKKEREDILRRFKNGEIRVVSNVQCLTVGFDFPELDCIIIARPTQSIRLFQQILGRGIRTSQGKSKCRVIDLAGNVKRFGKIENFEIVEVSPGMHRLRSDQSYLTGFDFYRNVDLEEKNYEGLKETAFKRNDDIIRFGKYKGVHISKIPNNYLEWSCQNMKGSWQKMFEKEKERRDAISLNKRMEEEVPF